MEQHSPKRFFFILFLFFFVLCSTTIAIVAILKAFQVTPSTVEEVEDESEFSYKVGSSTGPGNWGKIHKEWSLCNEGFLQSPIDLSDKKVRLVTSIGKLQQSYKPSPAAMLNRGHDIMIKFKDGAGKIRINKTDYFLKQLHWHSPSEHSINDTRFPLEMHMVHLSVDNKIAVVGMLYNIGKPDPFLAKMEKHIHAIRKSEHGEEVEVGMVNPLGLKSNNSSQYYRYIGSLTTPPCTEGVVWTIFRKEMTVSTDQVKLLRDAVHDESRINARPKQATNLRVVKLYRP